MASAEKAKSVSIGEFSDAMKNFNEMVARFTPPQEAAWKMHLKYTNIRQQEAYEERRTWEETVH